MFSRLIFVIITLTSFSVSADNPSAYDYDFKSIEGEPLPLSVYRGKVVMIVNTASFCGFTKQYRELQNVWENFREQGLVVLGVPSNDFGNQEPGNEAEIKNFCELNYGINFPMTAKVHVKGANAHPFYKWAVQEKGALAKPRWNFHKYLVGRDGRLVDWFATTTKPTATKVTRAIEMQLARVGQ